MYKQLLYFLLGVVSGASVAHLVMTTNFQQPVTPKVEAYNPTLELQHLKDRTTADPHLMSDCHMETHMIGHRAYQELGESAYDHLDPVCGGGYLHGIIEQAFKQNGMEYLERVVHDYCGEELTDACLHGVGHGIHGIIDDIPESIAACTELQSSGTDCFDGVFMDAFDADGMLDFTPPALEVALTACENTSAAAKPSCYFYLPRLLDQPLEVIQLCESNVIGDGWGGCAQGSGVHFMKTLANFDDILANDWCAIYSDPNLQILCSNGVSAYKQHGSIAPASW